MTTTNTLILAAGVLLASLVPSPVAHAEALTTTFDGGNANRGIMFDMLATNAIRITGFQVGFDSATTANIKLYSKPGTHVGSESDQSAWTDFGAQSLTADLAEGPGDYYQISKPILVGSGERRALYIQFGDLSTRISYTNGDGVGTLEASDSNLSIFEGVGVNALFGNLTQNRIPNVTIYYTLVDTTPPVVKLAGPKTVRTNDAKVTVAGTAYSDLGIDTVKFKYKVQRKSGKLRTKKSTVKIDDQGLFSKRIKSFKGTNPVRVLAFDTEGQRSTTSARVTIIGR